MEDLLAWLQENQFQIDTPSLDGKIYRFDRDGKMNAWFWGVRLHTTKSGQEYVIAKVGDWKTGEEFDFRTNVAFSREDKKIIQTQVKEAKEKADRAKEALHADAAEMAAAILGGARIEKQTEYMAKKQIPELYGCRVTKQSSIDAVTGKKTGRHGSEDVLLVPMRDVHGKLWGLQQIGNGTSKNKYFLTGQKKESCFHLIPDDTDLRSDEPIYICEGLATASSVYQATGGPVVVAFDAGNLISVCQAIRAESQDRPIIVCGDDDVWGRRPDGSPYNAGREKATEAAKLALGKAVFPKFRDERDRPTDWNDLHLREGLEEVKRQLLEVKIERHYVRCLGHRENTYFYTSSDNKEIVKIVNHNEEYLTDLMPKGYWETLYPAKKGVDWSAAANDLKIKCRARGVFSYDNIRGLGTWEDQGRIVVHLGNRLYVDGAEIGIHDLPGEFIYILGKPSPSIHKNPLTLEECQPIHKLMDLISFERPEQRYFLAGWVMAARLSGLLSWRPQIWITGESGSGKSTLLQQFISPMLGDQSKRFTGSTTEAGMRQTIRADAVPVIFDEFEPDGYDAITRVKACIEFIRQASTDSGHTTKGSAGGKSIQYKARFCAAVSAIKTLLNSQADRTRFTLIELRKIHQNTQQWQELQKALALITPEFADRYFARLLAMLPVIQENMRRFELAFAEKHSQRLGQQYGPLLAGWAALISDSVLHPEEIDGLVDSIDLKQEGAASGETDQEDCLQRLLQGKMTVQIKDTMRDDIATSTAIKQACEDPRYNREIGLYGLKIVRPHGGGASLFIANRNPQLMGLFRGSSWEQGWAGSLGRLPGAKRNATASINHHTVKGVILPLSVVLNNSESEQASFLV